MREKFRSLIEEFSEFWILCIAIETGILEAINRSSSLQEIAKGMDPEVIEALCNCLVSYGYLEKREGYTLTSDSRRYLLKSSSEYLGFFAESARVFNILSEFTDFITKGREITLSSREWDTVTKMSALIGEHIPSLLREKLPILGQTCSVLDLGCGRMRESIMLAESNSEMKVTGIESNSSIVNDVRSELVRKGLENRVTIVEGDVSSLPEGKFDVVFLNHILHCLPHEKNVSLLSHARKTLRDGYVVVFDDFLEDNRISPKESVRKNLLAKMFSSRIYSASELKDLLTEAGFSDIETIRKERRILAIGRVHEAV